MKPESNPTSERIPRFGGRAIHLAIWAETETLDTYKENLGKYRENNYTYVPIPRSGQYYNRETDSLHEITPSQYFDSADDYRDVFKVLAEEPFLIQDKVESLEVDVVSEDEFYLLPEDAPDHAVTKDADELETEYPGIADELGYTSGDRYRIITIADLNRRVVGEQLYPIIAELEGRIAEAIEKDVENPEKMYHNVSENVIGRREKDILENIEMHTAEYLSLGDMIGFLKGRSHLWPEFGFESANECGDRLGSIQDLRNRVMHSNRTLIRNRGDIRETLERVDDAQEIIAASH